MGFELIIRPPHSGELDALSELLRTCDAIMGRERVALRGRGQPQLASSSSISRRERPGSERAVTVEPCLGLAELGKFGGDIAPTSRRRGSCLGADPSTMGLAGHQARRAWRGAMLARSATRIGCPIQYAKKL